MNIDERIAQAVLESHPHDLVTIKRYIAWVKFRRKIHNAFYAPGHHWVKLNDKSFPSTTQPTLPITQERRKHYRVRFNAHWMNG